MKTAAYYNDEFNLSQFNLQYKITIPLDDITEDMRVNVLIKMIHKLRTKYSSARLTEFPYDRDEITVVFNLKDYVDLMYDTYKKINS